MKILTNIASLITCLSFLVLQGCGGSGGISSFSSLSDLPDTSSIVSSSSGGLSAVSGTPPLLMSITAANADTYFWNGMVAAINGAGTATAEQINQFWGGVDGGVGGEGACRMAQSTGFSFEPILRAGTSFCYMKGMPQAESGVTVTPAMDDPRTIFNQQAADRTVRVDVTGMPIRRADMKVFIKVKGTETVGSDVYAVDLWFCDDGINVNGYENVSVNKATGMATSTNVHNDAWGAGTSTISGKLTTSGGKIVYDPSADRTANVHHSGDWGAFKANITINGQNQIITKSFDQFTYNNGVTDVTENRKHYSVAGFSGSSTSTLRFLEAGFKGMSNSTEHVDDHGYSGGVEFQDTHYASVNSDLKAEAEAVDFGADNFWAGGVGAPTIDVSDYSCATPPDFVVTMDFNDPAVAAIGNDCEGDHVENMNFCDSEDINSAREIIFNSF